MFNLDTDKMFNEIFGDFFTSSSSYVLDKSLIETLENGDRKITKNIPGYNKSNVKIKFKGNVLSVDLLSKDGKTEKTLTYNISGVKFDLAKIEASVADGILTMIVPAKIADKSADFIEINVK